MATKRFKVTLPEGFALTNEHRAAIEAPHPGAMDEAEATAHAMIVDTESTPPFVVVRNVWAPTEAIAAWRVASRIGLQNEAVLTDEDPER